MALQNRDRYSAEPAKSHNRLLTTRRSSKERLLTVVFTPPVLFAKKSQEASPNSGSRTGDDEPQGFITEPAGKAFNQLLTNGLG